ncbi:MAG: O-antigen ligase family protein [Planctomycetales bacterium]|nr:O-antigen ligase family protein [Planctomycetales bacterium]
MIPESYRSMFIVLALGVVLAASTLYDMQLSQVNESFRLLSAACIAGSLGALALLIRYPLRALQASLIAAWPLHLFTVFFVWGCVAYHGNSQLNQVILYTVFGYATYLLLPLALLLDKQVFVAFIKSIALLSALLALPSFFGAMGYQDLLGIPLRSKPSYSDFSGIIASAGVFEHAEGHALQMAFGLLCSLYILRIRASFALYGVCFALCSLGLLVSQGRAAIFGVMIALMFAVLPPLFRQSRPFFVGTLGLAIVFPFLILPQLAAIPGLGSYFRVERGLSGREEAWLFALSAVQERPLTGHGFMASTQLTEDENQRLRKSGFSGAGTTFHNTFITKAVDLGWVGMGLYALIYFVPLWRICAPSDEPEIRDFLRSMIILILTAALFRDYNIGGIRSTAMIGTIFLGLTNLWGLVVQWGWNCERTGAPPVVARAMPDTSSAQALQ